MPVLFVKKIDFNCACKFVMRQGIDRGQKKIRLKISSQMFWEILQFAMSVWFLFAAAGCV